MADLDLAKEWEGCTTIRRRFQNQKEWLQFPVNAVDQHRSCSHHVGPLPWQFHWYCGIAVSGKLLPHQNVELCSHYVPTYNCLTRYTYINTIKTCAYTYGLAGPLSRSKPFIAWWNTSRPASRLLPMWMHGIWGVSIPLAFVGSAMQPRESKPPGTEWNGLGSTQILFLIKFLSH